jgi:hypothetical protein
VLDAARNAAHLRLRLLERYAGFQARDYLVVVGAARSREIGGHDERYPQLGRARDGK